MSNTGDFDAAKAIQGIRQQRAAKEAEKRAAEEAEEQRIQTERDNIWELLRHADKELEDIRNPIVSEFVITERWYTRTSKTIPSVTLASGLKAPQTSKLRSNEVATYHKDGIFFRRFGVAKVHKRETRYYGSWLSLTSTSGYRIYSTNGYRLGLVKLRQPRAGYAYVIISGWDPRDVGHICTDLTDDCGREIPNSLDRLFRLFASLEEAAEDIILGSSVEDVTKAVTQALDFVATGQLPKQLESVAYPEPIDTFEW